MPAVLQLRWLNPQSNINSFSSNAKSMSSTTQTWNRTGIIIPTVVVVASLSALAAQRMDSNVMALWLDWLRLKYQSRKLTVPISMEWGRWRCHGINIDDQDILWGEIKINNSWWELLRPSFRIRGYHLHVFGDPRDIRSFYPDPIDGKPNSQQAHPYGRRTYKANKEIRFPWSACIRAARDSQGRDVCIRMVCSKSNPTEELAILRYLRRPEVLKDPRNITIPVIEELEIFGLIFIVMPQWDRAWNHDFSCVNELMDATEVFLKYLDFIHEHRIVHMDLHGGNTAINTVNATIDFCAKGLRDPLETRYAVYDFGQSHMYPPDTRLDSVQKTMSGVGWGMRRWIEPNVPFNPFSVDVAAMAGLLQRYLRVLENEIPQVVPFFEQMTHETESERPTAHEALLRFQQLRASLTPEEIATPVRGRYWHPSTGISYKPGLRPKKQQ